MLRSVFGFGNSTLMSPHHLDFVWMWRVFTVKMFCYFSYLSFNARHHYPFFESIAICSTTTKQTNKQPETAQWGWENGNEDTEKMGWINCGPFCMIFHIYILRKQVSMHGFTGTIWYIIYVYNIYTHIPVPDAAESVCRIRILDLFMHKYYHILLLYKLVLFLSLYLYVHCSWTELHCTPYNLACKR